MRQWAGSVDVVQIPRLVRSLHAGWLERKGEREKIQLARVRYEETKVGHVCLVAQLKNGDELVFDINSSPESPSPQAPPVRTKNVRKDVGQSTRR